MSAIVRWRLWRFDVKAARRYRHMVGMNCNRNAYWRNLCARCLWWSLIGRHERERLRRIERHKALWRDAPVIKWPREREGRTETGPGAPNGTGADPSSTDVIQGRENGDSA